MFYKHSREGKIAILIVYVDDIILTGDDNVEMERLKKKLANDFYIKDFGDDFQVFTLCTSSSSSINPKLNI